MRQRNVLLQQAGGRLDDDAGGDARRVGRQAGRRSATGSGTPGRRSSSACAPLVTEAYGDLAGVATPVRLEYDPPWRRTGLAAALAEARDADVRRGVSTVGRTATSWRLSIDGLPARTHASQGEQRTLALALRLAAHRLVAERTGSTPVLVLDDVLSELDAGRATALLGHLPAGQVVITTAAAVSPRRREPDAGACDESSAGTRRRR